MDLQKQAEEREKFIEECVRLSKENKHLLIQAATGVGKALAVIKCIEASSSEKKWLIVVPEILQIGNYWREVEKHGYGWMRDSKIGHIICYASIHNFKGLEYNLVLNECQHLSEERFNDCQTIKFDQIISDSATTSTKIRERLYDLCPCALNELSLDEAIERGILPSPTIHLIGIELDNKIKRNERIIKKKVYKYTDLSMAKDYDKQIKIWDKKIEKLLEESKPYKWANNIKIRIGSKRKKFLAECKTERARELINTLKYTGKRFIIFCGSLEQSEELGGDASINSSRGKAHNLETLENFNKKYIDFIFFNKMGREGMNFTAIDGIIIIQLDSGNDDGLSFIQKNGRGMRADDPETWIIYCKGTQDEVYLRRALKNINKQYINYE